MKISVCGKGGSGKSTIVTLLANEARIEFEGKKCLIISRSDILTVIR